jgi:hypothetical protein
MSFKPTLTEIIGMMIAVILLALFITMFAILVILIRNKKSKNIPNINTIPIRNDVSTIIPVNNQQESVTTDQSIQEAESTSITALLQEQNTLLKTQNATLENIRDQSAPKSHIDSSIFNTTLEENMKRLKLVEGPYSFDIRKDNQIIGKGAHVQITVLKGKNEKIIVPFAFCSYEAHDLIGKMLRNELDNLILTGKPQTGKTFLIDETYSSFPADTYVSLIKIPAILKLLEK